MSPDKHPWIKTRDELLAAGSDESKAIQERVFALTELFFHCGQDRHEASKAVRMIQDMCRQKT